MTGSDEPSGRQIAREVVIFALLCLLVGGLFVAVRVMRDGPQILQSNPHASPK